MPQDNTQTNIPTINEEEVQPAPKVEAPSAEKNEKDEEVDKFDRAFSEAAPVIQDYILGNKFEDNIKLICQIDKLNEEKANVIIENVAVSILVGLLPLEEARNTLLESFKISGVAIEISSAESILKNIDTYILSGIRKQVLQEKNGSIREIKHLTLKESNLEKEKAELRKILLERTGVLTGKGATLIQYKDRAIESLKKEAEKENNNTQVKSLKDSVMNRDSLLAKISIKDLSDTDKIKERMMQIKAEEEVRLAKLIEEEKAKEGLREKRKELEEKRKVEMEEFNKENEAVLVEEKVKEEENENISKLLAKELSEKLENNADQEVDLDLLREKRAKEEAEKQKNTVSHYSKAMSGSSANTSGQEKDFDPYREDF
ncbi:MAG: hypothetical protein QG630_67 [Patescibacteria group bacterium]|nr:hypothetical protein [Patescibacteria group bacterium]